jgi:23S rRNA maturation mini-RNase III
MSKRNRCYNQPKTELSDAEIRLRTLEIIQNVYGYHNPFELIARSIALARYIKTGKYNRSSGNVTEQIDSEYIERIYDQLSEKRYEPKQSTDNANNKSNIPKTDISLFKKLFSCFRNK